MRTKEVWLVATLLWLVIIPLQSHLDAVLEDYLSCQVALAFMFQGWVFGILAVTVRQMSVCPPRTVPGLAASLGWTSLSLAISTLAFAGCFLLFLHARTIPLSLLFVVLTFFLLFPPIVAGYCAAPPLFAIARSIGLVKYIWAVLAANAGAFVLGYGTDCVGRVTVAPLGFFLQAVLHGMIWTALTVFLISKLDPSRAPAACNSITTGPNVVSLLWNLFLAYCAAVADILIKYVVPEALLEWDPLFGNWSLFWRMCFAGTTGSLILSICITLLLMRVTRGPLPYRLTAVAVYRLVYLLFFPGLALLVKFPLPFVFGMAFFLCLGWTYLLAFGKGSRQATVHQG